MDDAKQQLADKIKNSNNILVTVSRDPSVDQLAACLGLALLLNKLNKHAAAVFSGEVPSTLEFLKPEDTLEKNTDSLRDFIIALDKSKADKLRYKVEDNIVRIFITPYRTSITEDDLQFSQGDFNVDVVVALGVRDQNDLDQAITAHGRILHDATVGTINIATQADLGGINWNDPGASSLSELVAELAQAINKDLIDGQIATALLTGIVAETDRFSNHKTSAQTMSVSAALMAAGANQQLVATKLASGEPEPTPIEAAPVDKPEESDNPPKKQDPGTLEITHSELPEPSEEPLEPMPEEVQDAPQPDEPEPPVLPDVAPPAAPADDHLNLSPGSKMIIQPPTLGGTLSANVRPESLDPSTDPLTLPAEQKGSLLNHDAPAADAGPKSPAVEPPAPTQPEPPLPPEPETATPVPEPPTPPAPPVLPPDPEAPEPKPYDDKSNQTLTQLERLVGSPHEDDATLDQARDEVTKAFDQSTEPTTPQETQPLPEAAVPAEPAPPSLAFDPAKFGITSDPTQPPAGPPAEQPAVIDPNAPPPVPPPFQFGNSSPPAGV